MICSLLSMWDTDIFRRFTKHMYECVTSLFQHSSSTASLVFLSKGITLFFSQGEVPQKSIVGCIRDLRVSKVLFADPAVNHGVMPCFKGVTEKGVYFAGNGAHLVLGLALMLIQMGIVTEK